MRNLAIKMMITIEKLTGIIQELLVPKFKPDTHAGNTQFYDSAQAEIRF